MFHPQGATAAREVKKPRIIAAMIRPTDSTAAGINECIFSRKKRNVSRQELNKTPVSTENASIVALLEAEASVPQAHDGR